MAEDRKPRAYRRGFIALVAWIYATAAWFAVEGWRGIELRLQDVHSAATGLYSLRRMNDSYNGPIAKVQRDRDQSTLDIGAVDDMRKFCAYTTCVVRTMYDQSGNGAHMHKVD